MQHLVPLCHLSDTGGYAGWRGSTRAGQAGHNPARPPDVQPHVFAVRTEL